MVGELHDVLRKLYDPRGRREGLLAVDSGTSPSQVNPGLQLDEVVEMIVSHLDPRFYARFAEPSDQDCPVSERQAARMGVEGILWNLHETPLHREDMPDPETPPSELHRALQVPEVVWMIVSFLDPRPDEEMADLAALAQCRIFHGPALDALWRHQGTIRNLIDCMPDGLWVVETVQRRKILVSTVGLNWISTDDSFVAPQSSSPSHRLGPSPSILPPRPVFRGRFVQLRVPLAGLRSVASRYPRRLSAAESRNASVAAG
jgi:hypothetical protein